METKTSLKKVNEKKMKGKNGNITHRLWKGHNFNCKVKDQEKSKQQPPHYLSLIVYDSLRAEILKSKYRTEFEYNIVK